MTASQPAAREYGLKSVFPAISLSLRDGDEKAYPESHGCRFNLPADEGSPSHRGVTGAFSVYKTNSHGDGTRLGLSNTNHNLTATATVSQTVTLAESEGRMPASAGQMACERITSTTTEQNHLVAIAGDVAVVDGVGRVGRVGVVAPPRREGVLS